MSPADGSATNDANRRIVTLIVAGLVAVALVIVALVIRVPYVELVPNPPCDTLGSCDGNVIVSIPDHKTYPTKGHLYLTDVGIFPGTADQALPLSKALRGWRDRDVAVVPKEVIFPPSQSVEQNQQQNTREMVESQRDAKAAALNALGLMPAELKVVQFSKHSPAQAAGMAVGDFITAIDGKAVPDENTLTTLIRKHRIGDPVRVTYTHDGVTHTVTVRAVASDNTPQAHPIVGVGIDPVARGKLPFKISIGLENVGGPSAGLMFALGIYDLLTPGYLTGGQSIAGTGTIKPDGTVGVIGGVEQKVAGAREAGARYFLTPAGNCGDAKDAPHNGVTLVKVDTLDDALSALAKIRGEDGRLNQC